MRNFCTVQKTTRTVVRTTPVLNMNMNMMQHAAVRMSPALNMNMSTNMQHAACPNMNMNTCMHNLCPKNEPAQCHAIMSSMP